MRKKNIELINKNNLIYIIVSRMRGNILDHMCGTGCRRTNLLGLLTNVFDMPLLVRTTDKINRIINDYFNIVYKILRPS